MMPMSAPKRPQSGSPMGAPKRPQPKITTDEPVGVPKVGQPVQPGTPMGAPKVGQPIQPGAGAPTGAPKRIQPGGGGAAKGSSDLVKQLAKKKAQVAVPTPNRPAGTVDTGMGMSNPKRPAPGQFGKGNPTPKRPDSTFRIS